ncbi:MAG: SpoVA/SpoVAEb family sporulation membrane protein [Oscillospiraceae bacterium]|nr:SpoVA/SpoVAEb family sporulation membrane protein [Oscillospiraceae bacterium]
MGSVENLSRVRFSDNNISGAEGSFFNLKIVSIALCDLFYIFNEGCFLLVRFSYLVFFKNFFCCFCHINTSFVYHLSVSIIPHRCFNANTFQKLTGPNMTAAEDFVLGLGAKMFVIAGPVIVYGTAASVVYGIIYWITTLL